MSPDSDHEIDVLPVDYPLLEYRLRAVLARGGFGVTYRGEAPGGAPVAVKEFLPSHLAARVDGQVRARTRGLEADYLRLLQDFLDEAASLERLPALDHIEPVIRSFRANGTAYLVTALVTGVGLEEHLASLGRRPGEAETRGVLLPLLDDLAVVHAAGVCHGDIAPRTILVRPDGTPVLVDFAVARRAAGYDVRSRALTGAADDGYRPYEHHYRGGRPGPWTDLYALAAVAYRTITGAPPPDGLRRRLEPDTCVPAVEAAAGAGSPAFLAAIDWALMPEVGRRPQSVAAWRPALAGPPPAGAGPMDAGAAGWPARRVALSAGAGLALIAMLALTAMPWHRGHSSPASTPASAPVTLAPGPAVSEDNGDDGSEMRLGSVFRDCADKDETGTNICPQMVILPPGTFRMGSPPSEDGRHANEGPEHQVSIAYPLAVGRFAVTFGEWDACAAAGGCGDRRPADKGWGRGARPVIDVSWDDAHRYLAWLSQRTGQPYRLLSEAEWEYAARAGTEKARYWGNQIGRKLGNCSGCGGAWDGKQTAPVGSFPANRFGLFDMLGNVWQWVEDCYHEGYERAPTDGSAWTSGGCGYRVLRGGSWFANPSHLRSAYRGGSSSSYRGDDNGFRVARPVTVAPPL